MKNLFILLTFIFLVISCSTGYQKDGGFFSKGGYSEQFLSKNKVIVSFRANAATSEKKAYLFALRRSAELTLENNYDYFIVGEASVKSKDTSYTSSVNCQTSYNGNTVCTGGNTYNYKKPRINLTIIMKIGKVPDQANAHNANDILSNISMDWDLNL